eukprot:11348131-Karenia_brevis.AAC.1
MGFYGILRSACHGHDGLAEKIWQKRFLRKRCCAACPCGKGLAEKVCQIWALPSLGPSKKSSDG